MSIKKLQEIVRVLTEWYGKDALKGIRIGTALLMYAEIRGRQ